MFLKSLMQKNPEFLQAVVRLHQEGSILPNSYVVDLDALASNTRLFVEQARARGLTTYAMTKQLGRAGAALDAITAAGVDGYVAVDMDCARPISSGGHRLGHLGHLVQVSRHEVGEAAVMHPEFWTVFSPNKATQVAEAARRLGQEQKLLVRVFGDGDEFYAGHEGGVALSDLPQMLDHIAGLEGVSFGGLTTFPALLFDPQESWVRVTPNMSTLAKAAELAKASELARRDFGDVQINAPGTTSSAVLDVLAEAGATQVEPGHGLTGTTPVHAVRDLPEVPALLYLSEVAHLHQGTPMCYGGGLYIDPVFEDYEVRALLAGDPQELSQEPVPAEMPDPAAIDYYTRLFPPKNRVTKEGASVIFGFRIQAFVTRARIVGIAGVARGAPEAVGCWNSFGQPLSLPVPAPNPEPAPEPAPNPVPAPTPEPAQPEAP